MAHFRAVIRGQRGEASRLGSKASGISTLLQTWGYDVRARAHVGSDGQDYVTVYIEAHDGSESDREVMRINASTGAILWTPALEVAVPA